MATATKRKPVKDQPLPELPIEVWTAVNEAAAHLGGSNESLVDEAYEQLRLVALAAFSAGAKKPSGGWQVQIFDCDVGEWYGWAHSDYDETDKADAERAARIARQRGWQTRVVQIR